MNPRELVDHIHSGPAELVLDKPLPFRRLTHSNLCDFKEFLQALQSSETIRTVRCGSHREFNISENEWVLLAKALGCIKDIQHLDFFCEPGSRDFNPYHQAVADAVNNAHSLCKLFVVTHFGSFPSEPSSGLIALANALRELPALQEFIWFDFGSRQAPRDLSLDPVLWALSACPHLQKVIVMTNYASADAVKSLLH
jgi:hypothetical protein